MKVHRLVLFVVTLLVALAPTPKVAQACGTVPAAGQAALQQLADMFPTLIRSDNDDDRRAWILKAAQQLAFSVSPAWGTKDAGGGRPPSKDAIAKVVDGTLCGWDIVNGSTRALTFGVGEPLPGQHFIPVSPVNHLGAGPVVTPPPPPAGVTRAELDAAIRAAIVQLHTDLWNEVDGADRELRGRLDRLEARPTLDLSVLQAAIDAALLNYEVNGKTRTDRLGLQHAVQLPITRKR